MAESLSVMAGYWSNLKKMCFRCKGVVWGRADQRGDPGDRSPADQRGGAGKLSLGSEWRLTRLLGSELSGSSSVRFAAGGIAAGALTMYRNHIVTAEDMNLHIQFKPLQARPCELSPFLLFDVLGSVFGCLIHPA
jgi:hypothetical protein